MSCESGTTEIKPERPEATNGPFYRVHCSCGGGSGLYTTEAAAESFAGDPSRPCIEPELFQGMFS